MKKLILITIASMISWSAFATSVVAEYDFGSYGANGSAHLVKAVLLENGELNIELAKVENNGFGPFDFDTEASKFVTAQINNKNLELVGNIVKSLMNAKVVTTYSEIICMMMPSPLMNSNHLRLNRSYDYDNQVYTGPVELVLGPEGCWLNARTHFEHDWSTQQARKLKSIIEILVNEHIGNELL